MKGRWRSVTTVGVLLVVLSGCASEVTFHPRRLGAGEPVLALAGPMPYQLPVTHAPSETPAVVSQVADVYAATRPGMLSTTARRLPPRVYVPAGRGIEVIDSEDYSVSGRIKSRRPVHRVTPSWDQSTLWVTTSRALIPLDAASGKLGEPVRVRQPRVMRFTVDGQHALVVAGRRLDIRDPVTMRRIRSVSLPCRGPEGADLSADGSYLMVSCARSGRLVRVDLRSSRPDIARPDLTGQWGNRARIGVASIRLGRRAEPADVRLSPDGTVFYVSDRKRGGVWTVPADGAGAAAMPGKAGFVRTGRGAHGLVPGRYSDVLYVPGRGSIAVISFATRRMIARWKLPGSRPGMGGVSPDGRILWVRDRDRLRVVSVNDGREIREVRIKGGRAYGLSVHPQPGRFSIGPVTR